MSLALVENSVINIERLDNNTLTHNGLEYEIHIDVGEVIINGDKFTFSLESNNIHINGMCYHFDGYIFNIFNNFVKCRGSMYPITEFLINTNREGRIHINNNIHYLTIVDNVLTVGETRVYIPAENNVIRQYNVIQNVEEEHHILQHNARLEHIRQFNLRNNIINGIDPNRTPDMVQRDHMARLANDNQNVHDTFILNELKKILNKLQQKTKITKTMNQSLKEIENYMNNKANNTIISKITQWFVPRRLTKINIILNYIKTSNGYIGTFGMRELEVLHIIWNAIYDNEDLKHILYTNMLDMSNFGMMVCLTGRVTRMLDIFSGIIEEYTFETKNVREEMMNKCAKIRTDLNIDDEEKLKEEIKKVLHKDYVESNIMTIDDFNTEINEWIDYI